MEKRRRRPFGLVISLCVLALVVAASAAGASDPYDLVPGTAVLADNFASGGGNGGNTSSTSSSTSIFSPSVFVDYKRFGGEPTVTVDRFPGGNDVTYVSGPNGFVFPHYSPFFKSSDLGQTFRIPAHVPSFGQTFGTGGGGGDSYQVVGPVTHKVFFVDLPGPGCVTMNTSTDQGETWVGDNIGCGQSPGAIDDRQWDAVDETAPLPAGNTGNVYVSFINFTNVAATTLALARSTHDGAPGTFVTDSVCNTLNGQVPTSTTCPDPLDPALQVAGPPVVDIYNTHNIYIPFVRNTPVIPGVSGGPPYSLWVAKSTDGGSTWTRNQVASLGDHNPQNLFPEMTVDKAGNLYYTWSQTQGPSSDSSGLTGEQDVYYTFSTDRGTTWAAPIPLTQESNDSAVMPWMVAGDPGRVDLVYYKANSGLNSNVGFDSSGNPMVWNVYFAQSLNALNKGSNFRSVQISDHPNHLGGICTAGLSCSGDRDLLDFFTVDIDHLGAANVVWADDNTSRGSDTRNKFARQLSGVSVFKNQSISLMNTWPIKDHSVTDRAGDTYDELGVANPACPGMDLLGASANRSGDVITVSLTLDSAPTAAKAMACSNAPGVVTGGIWSVEFWAASDGNPEGYGQSYFIGYRDNPPNGAPVGEAGRFDNTNPTITSLEYHHTQAATVGGTCVAATPPAGPCTITLTTSANGLGIKSGAGMYSITGLSTFFGGSDQTTPVAFRLELGNSEQSDATAPFDVNGTGTTSP
ncbi:MAG: exo-alpha-sialidase [Actinobacteria bacterium]|nr:MAG: exo-alpha-sialidase [Actinomycetota bacterium]